MGDAENLSNIRDGIIDILINVESSHCYGNMPAFLREVERVLKPGGYFSFADFRGTDQVNELDAMIDATPLEL
ncbi:MAG: methyltransferase domain-containing protein [Kangiellaceae bacterium]|nr:methyltransferase domain-containing protein [Kangiellaceae bacterium]